MAWGDHVREREARERAMQFGHTNLDNPPNDVQSEILKKLQSIERIEKEKRTEKFLVEIFTGLIGIVGVWFVFNYQFPKELKKRQENTQKIFENKQVKEISEQQSFHQAKPNNTYLLNFQSPKYPIGVLNKRIGGMVSYQAHYHKGHFSYAKIIKTSGNGNLDDAALAMIKLTANTGAAVLLDDAIVNITCIFDPELEKAYCGY